jgi:hypothetical protein
MINKLFIAIALVGALTITACNKKAEDEIKVSPIPATSEESLSDSIHKVKEGLGEVGDKLDKKAGDVEDKVDGAARDVDGLVDDIREGIRDRKK